MLCWRHTQLLTRWTKDGVTKETVDYKGKYVLCFTFSNGI